MASLRAEGWPQFWQKETPPGLHPSGWTLTGLHTDAMAAMAQGKGGGAYP